MKQIFHCLIKVLSPVHIGCGEVYEPTGFVVNEQKKEMTVFDPFKFIGELSEVDKERLMAICQGGSAASILEVYKFFRNKPAAGNQIKLCNGFLKHYSATLSMSVKDRRRIQQELNNFSIHRTAFLSGSDMPFLPGSSVKGSLRTALLNLRQKSSPVRQDNREKNASVKLEEKLLNYTKLEEDPFRLVKVSDFMPAGTVKRKVIYAVDVKKKPGSELGAYQIVEAVMPGALFWGSVVIDEAIKGSGIQKPIRLKELMESAKEFYETENRRENTELNNAGCQAFNVGRPDAFLLRVGRHSGAECVTIKDHRDIRIMRGKSSPLFLDHATTFWLGAAEKKPQSVSGLIPFGWVEIVKISEADFNQYRNAPVISDTNSMGAQNTVSS